MTAFRKWKKINAYNEYTNGSIPSLSFMILLDGEWLEIAIV